MGYATQKKVLNDLRLVLVKRDIVIEQRDKRIAKLEAAINEALNSNVLHGEYGIIADVKWNLRNALKADE